MDVGKTGRRKKKTRCVTADSTLSGHDDVDVDGHGVVGGARAQGMVFSTSVDLDDEDMENDDMEDEDENSSSSENGDDADGGEV